MMMRRTASAGDNGKAGLPEAIRIEDGALACTLSPWVDAAGCMCTALSIRDRESGRELLHAGYASVELSERGALHALESYRAVIPSLERVAESRRRRHEGVDCEIEAIGEVQPHHPYSRWRCRTCGAVSFTPRRSLPPHYCSGCGSRVVGIAQAADGAGRMEGVEGGR